MGNSVKPTDNDIAIQKGAMRIQYEAMFDQDTRAKMDELGIAKFMDHVALVLATQDAYVRFYANCLHTLGE